MKAEYGLNVRKAEHFLYQVDCFETYEEAAQKAKTVSLSEGENTDIVRIEYDEEGNEIAAYSV